MRQRWWGLMLPVALCVWTEGALAAPPLPPPRPPDLARHAPPGGPAAEVPLPPPRPADPRPPAPGAGLGLPMPRAVPGPPAPPTERPVFGPPMPPRAAPLAGPAPAAPVGPGVPIADELACVRLFTGGKVEARAVPPPVPAAPGCGIPAPVEVSAVRDLTGRRIPFEPPVTIDCTLGAAVADWVREDLVPAFAAGPGPLVALAGTSGYACRGRNGVAGAKISEHGRGNAMDIGGFRTASALIGVKQAGATVLATVRDSACARFATVLGPGSDGYHESHMHVDLEERRHGSKICHWDLP